MVGRFPDTKQNFCCCVFGLLFGIYCPCFPSLLVFRSKSSSIAVLFLKSMQHYSWSLPDSFSPVFVGVRVCFISLFVPKQVSVFTNKYVVWFKSRIKCTQRVWQCSRETMDRCSKLQNKEYFIQCSWTIAVLTRLCLNVKLKWIRVLFFQKYGTCLISSNSKAMHGKGLHLSCKNGPLHFLRRKVVNGRIVVWILVWSSLKHYSKVNHTRCHNWGPFNNCQAVNY